MGNSITFFPGRGVFVDSALYDKRRSQADGTRGRRGCIKGWSLNSRRRLREFLLFNAHPADQPLFSLTLTVPGPSLSSEEKIKVWKSFKWWLTRHAVPTVWRLEVQGRGQVHWHCLVSLPEGLSEGSIKQAWSKALDSLGQVHHKRQIALRSLLSGAANRSFHIVPFDGSARWFRYVSDHTSKGSHQDANGFGRHWGVVCKSLFVSAPHESFFNISNKAYSMFSRWSRRLRSGAKPQGGIKWKYYKSTRGMLGRGSSVSFGDPDTYLRLLQYALELCSSPGLYSFTVDRNIKKLNRECYVKDRVLFDCRSTCRPQVIS